MFSNGHNPNSALEKYTAALQLELDDEFEFARILADRRIVPDIKYLYRLVSVCNYCGQVSFANFKSWV